MKKIESWKFRKCSDIEREFPYFEVVCGDESILELAATDSRELEVLFESGCVGSLITFDELELILKKGRELLADEMGT